MTTIDPQAVVVSREAFDSEEPDALVNSNIEVVNALQEEHFMLREISQNALRSYYADFFIAEILNGGFSQFVYNSHWDEEVIRYTREGLGAIGALKHLSLLEQTEALLASLSPEQQEAFFSSEYFGENEERDLLSQYDDRFSELQEVEDVVALNSAWLRAMPGLVVLTDEEIADMIESRAAALPDREERQIAALENEPRFMKLIRALCAVSGQTLDRVTAGDPTYEFEGEQTLAWHFLTDQGHHHMVEIGDVGIMFKGHTTEEICRVELTNDDDIDETDDFEHDDSDDE